MDVLLKSMANFNFKNIHAHNLEVKQHVKSKFPAITFESSIFDLIYADDLHKQQFKKLFLEGRLHNDSMILINGIHNNPKTWQQWKELITLPEITVSIDMFYCGALFIRREQVKEHFTIRI